MKFVQKTKYTIATLLFVFATTALSFVNVEFASAAAIQWTGGGDGTSFSDTANWSGAAVPQDGDVLTFSVTGLSASVVLDNDIVGLSLDGIVFSGTVTDYNVYSIEGEDLTLNGNVSNTITGTNAGTAIPAIRNNLTLSSNVTVSKVNLGETGSTLNLLANTLTYSGTASCGLTLNSNLSGSGALNLTGTGLNLKGTSSSYTGAIAVTGTAWAAPAALGTAAAGTTVSGSGDLSVVNSSDVSLAEPFTFGGSGSFSSTQNYTGCSGGSSPSVTLTLTGGVTLTSDFLYKGNNNLVVNAPYTSNGFAFTVGSGVAGTLTTPEGESTAPEETIQLDGTSSTYVNVGNNQTAFLNGTRDTIGVQSGGTLKGTGTADSVSVEEGGVIAPGNSPGTLTILETFTLSGTYEAELLNASTYDKLVVGQNYVGGGNAVFLNNGVLSLVLSDGWSVTQGDAFTIVDNRSSTAVSGTFLGLAEGAQVAISGITFSISYVGGDGNDIVLTALNTGTDPDAPNTGALQIVRKNPLVVAGFGIAAAALLVTLAVRRRQSSK